MPRQCMLVLCFLYAAFLLCGIAHASPGLEFVAYQDGAKKRISDVKTIVIDPGHGGKDEGAKGESNLKEKDIALRIGLFHGQDRPAPLGLAAGAELAARVVGEADLDGLVGGGRVHPHVLPRPHEDADTGAGEQRAP